MAKRITVCAGDTPLGSLVSASTTEKIRKGGGSSEDVFSSEVAERCAISLASGHAHMEQGFISGGTLAELRVAANALLSGGPASPGLSHAVVAIDLFRAALAKATGRPLLEEAELQLLGYKAGGSYRRHCDDAAGLTIGKTGRQVRRSVSVLVYLTDDDWSPEKDGGALRVFPPKGYSGPHVDVPPLPGALVVFDSATIPHEVLTTHRPRVALAGWLQEAR